MNTTATYMQYADYIKPDWAPPAWLFGPVWTILYTIIAITFGYVLYKYANKQIPLKTIAPFALNIFFNVIFTPIQFGLMSMQLAAVDILFVWATIIWFMTAIWKKYKWVTIANIPYLLWVSFATILQLTVLYLNS